VKGILIGCLYLPNGNPAPGPKFDYKLRRFNRLIVHAAESLSSSLPVILAGDYNVMPTDLDVYKPERWVDDALFGRRSARPSSSCSCRAGPTPWISSPRREALHLLGLLPECLRARCWPPPRPSPAQPFHETRRLRAGVDRDVRGWERASGHAPTWVELAGEKEAARGTARSARRKGNTL
jgi:exodeoxyribonuclease III